MPKTLRLILGDQLNQCHSWFRDVSPSITYLMMEMRQETDYVVHHVQKVVAFFAAMRCFAAWLSGGGHKVHYLRLDDPANTQDLSDNIKILIDKEDFARFEYLLPDEYRLDRQLNALCSALRIPSQSHDTEHFLNKRSELDEFFGSKPYLMEYYYRRNRRLNNWLMDGEKPEGGRWNYDRENRKALPHDAIVPSALVFSHDISQFTRLLDSCRVKTIGSIDPQRFPWPLNREEALQVLDSFLNDCLVNFGRYQDAMHTDHHWLFHSRLSFSLNTKMLSPHEVVEKVLAAYRENDHVDLPAAEGFIRQIAGWREFMRGVYWARMPGYKTMNVLDHQRPLPHFYWTGETEMNCLRHAIGQSLEEAYAHHIQRLMITGNFALLAGIHPDAVDRWYLGIYIDALEWVEITNTRGMSQYADGGIVATKPYVSSANYINKMSNYCRSCRYDRQKRTSEDSCPFNALYWNFLITHAEHFKANHRMRMIYSRLSLMSEADRTDIIERAGTCLGRLDRL
jgi:deoxyribodipyrimidine photolyase-related protein